MSAHGAAKERLRPWVGDDAPPHAALRGELYAFRDDLGQWIAFPTGREASAAAHREDAPGPQRAVESVTFGKLLEDNPKNLVHLFEQYYWAEDLA
jgi:hypothetical protein